MPMPQTHRYKTFSIEQENLIYILEGRLEFQGFPKEVKVVAVQHNFCSSCFDILLESEEFEEITLGTDPPRLPSDKYIFNIFEVPREQFGCSIFHVSEKAEKLTDKDGNIKFREFL